MKRLIPALCCLLFSMFIACSVEEPERDPNLVSKWELIESLQNDGNKSVYKPVDYFETVEFRVDSQIKRSSSWCPEANIRVAEYSNEEKVITAGCGEEVLNITYTIKGDLLFIYPNCVQECALKYRRIDHLLGFVR